MNFVQVLTFAVFIGAVLTVQPDPLIEGNYRVTDSNGKQVEYWRKDPLVDGQMRIYDTNGRLKGTIREDPLFRNRFELKDEQTDIDQGDD